jgi:hypothetical protein
VSKIVHFEFLGSRGLLIVLCLTGIGIPLAIVYFLESLVAVHEELKNPSQFVENWRAGKR